MIIHLLPEGHLEEFVGQRLIAHCGHSLGTIYRSRGCAYIKDKAARYYSLATAHSGILILTDFRDSKTACPGQAIQAYILGAIPFPAQSFICRFAVQELEAWLLADKEGLSAFLGVAKKRLPLDPEAESLPKQALVNLARKSRKKKILEGIVPSSEHQGSVAPLYNATLADFILNHWNINAAQENSPSLRRCVQRLSELA